ncbi:hypothetical protein NN561_008386 [Cricetulus griseus]
MSTAGSWSEGGRWRPRPSSAAWPLAPHLRDLRDRVEMAANRCCLAGSSGLRDATEVVARCCCFAGFRTPELQLCKYPFTRACLGPIGYFDHQEQECSPDSNNVHFLVAAYCYVPAIALVS